MGEEPDMAMALNAEQPSGGRSWKPRDLITDVSRKAALRYASRVVGFKMDAQHVRLSKGGIVLRNVSIASSVSAERVVVRGRQRALQLLLAWYEGQEGPAATIDVHAHNIDVSLSPDGAISAASLLQQLPPNLRIRNVRARFVSLRFPNPRADDVLIRRVALRGIKGGMSMRELAGCLEGYCERHANEHAAVYQPDALLHAPLHPSFDTVDQAELPHDAALSDHLSAMSVSSRHGGDDNTAINYVPSAASTAAFSSSSSYSCFPSASSSASSGNLMSNKPAADFSYSERQAVIADAEQPVSSTTSSARVLNSMAQTLARGLALVSVADVARETEPRVIMDLIAQGAVSRLVANGGWQQMLDTGVATAMLECKDALREIAQQKLMSRMLDIGLLDAAMQRPSVVKMLIQQGVLTAALKCGAVEVVLRTGNESVARALIGSKLLEALAKSRLLEQVLQKKSLK